MKLSFSQDSTRKVPRVIMIYWLTTNCATRFFASATAIGWRTPASIEQFAVVFDGFACDKHDQISSFGQLVDQRLVIIADGLHAENNLVQSMPVFECLDLFDQAPKPYSIVGEDQTPLQRLPRGGAEESVVLVLGNIDPNDQMITRTTDLLSELAKPFKACNVIHFENLLLLSECCFSLLPNRRYSHYLREKHCLKYYSGRSLSFLF